MLYYRIVTDSRSFISLVHLNYYLVCEAKIWRYLVILISIDKLFAIEVRVNKVNIDLRLNYFSMLNIIENLSAIVTIFTNLDVIIMEILDIK